MQKEAGDVYFKAVWMLRYMAAGRWQHLRSSRRVLGVHSGGCEGWTQVHLAGAWGWEQLWSSVGGQRLGCELNPACPQGCQSWS